MFESIKNILFGIFFVAFIYIFVDWLDLRRKIKDMENHYKQKIRDKELEFKNQLDKERARFDELYEDYKKLKEKEMDK